jgi:alkanesulfonate monooxygenase SsuD/methylene tetrahydromethanopterin reductase-like flavin-dependent oxidoreductase (luciferase family)
MLELAGEIADGVLLNWIPPEAVPASIGHLEAGAKRAGRSLDDFEIAGFIRTTVTDEPDVVRAGLARDITGYAIVDVYANFFRGVGYADEMTAITTQWKAGDRAGAVREVSPRVLDGLGMVGDERFCRERVKAFADAGLTMPVILPFVPEGAEPALRLVTRGAEQADEHEIAENPRAASVRLRAVERVLPSSSSPSSPGAAR